MELITGWFVFSILIAFIANLRGRNGIGWFLISLMLSPLIGLILVLALPKQGEAGAPRDESGQIITTKSHVRCPDCRELVRHDANKCKHCGTMLVPQ